MMWEKYTPIYKDFCEFQSNIRLPNTAHAVQQKLSSGSYRIPSGEEGIELLQDVLPSGEVGACAPH